MCKIRVKIENEHAPENLFLLQVEELEMHQKGNQPLEKSLMHVPELAGSSKKRKTSLTASLR